jgi:hypothetical protein
MRVLFRLLRHIKRDCGTLQDGTQGGRRIMENLEELIHEIEMNEWRKLGAQRAKEREEAGK